MYCNTATAPATRRWAGREERPQQAQVGAAGGRACDMGVRALGRVGRAAAGAGACGRQARGEAGRAAWACYWATGCALGALSLFLARFNSVLFLSQFFDIVREPGSCSNFFY